MIAGPVFGEQVITGVMRMAKWHIGVILAPWHTVVVAATSWFEKCSLRVGRDELSLVTLDPEAIRAFK